MSRGGSTRSRHKSQAGRGKPNPSRRTPAISVPGGLDSVFGVHAVRAAISGLGIGQYAVNQVVNLIHVPLGVVANVRVPHGIAALVEAECLRFTLFTM